MLEDILFYEVIFYHVVRTRLNCKNCLFDNGFLQYNKIVLSKTIPKTENERRIGRKGDYPP